MDKFLPYFLLGLALAALGVFLLIRGGKKKSRRSSWVMGTISAVDQELDVRTDLDADKSGEVRRYRYKPTFSYQVSGQSYTCRGVYAYDAKHRFQVGDTARIWYDPQNPADAASGEEVKSKNKSGLLLILIGVAFCVLACTQLG